MQTARYNETYFFSFTLIMIFSLCIIDYVLSRPELHHYRVSFDKTKHAFLSAAFIAILDKSAFVY